jgi:hypothetical protein
MSPSSAAMGEPRTRRWRGRQQQRHLLVVGAQPTQLPLAHGDPSVEVVDQGTAAAVVPAHGSGTPGGPGAGGRRPRTGRWRARPPELDPQAAVPVDYLAERDQHKPPEQRGSYRVVEDTMTITGRRKRDPVLRVRWVLVWSSARAGAAATARARKLERLQRGLGSRHYPDADAATARLAAIARSRRVTGLLRAQVGVDPATGKPTLAWWFDPAALEGEQATDGWYGLLTNLDPAQVDAAGVLARYKGQEVVERRYGSFKGPLAVAPLFVQSNRRIQALVTVICLALLVFCLVERQLRRAIAPKVTLEGLSVGRPAKPTGRLIFQALAGLRLIPARGHDPPIIPQPPPLQARLLHLLDVDPTQPA